MTDCPLTAAFAAVGGKWKLIIIYWLAQEELHFAGLRRRMTSISHKVLTDQLRELEADEIVQRAPLGKVPAPVMYRLTEYGRTLLPLVEGIRAWGRGHIDRMIADARSQAIASREMEGSPGTKTAKATTPARLGKHV